MPAILRSCGFPLRAAPMALMIHLQAYPALTRWANFWRTSGA